MQTPAGNECKFFYGDYYRGKNQEECRLLFPANLEWKPYLCEKCPIPEILRANSCEHMEFAPKLARPFPLMKPQVQVTAYCKKSETQVEEPKIGCGQCHPVLNLFIEAPNDPNNSR